MERDYIILRRLTTSDGIVGPIEEMREYRPRELRACQPKIKAMATPLDVMGEQTIDAREYHEEKRTFAILIEMKEK